MTELPDADDIVMVLAPADRLDDDSVIDPDQEPDVRVVRWGELVSGVLSDSGVAEISTWMRLFGMSVPSSTEVAEAESADSDLRVLRVTHLLLALEPMVRVLSMPVSHQVVSLMKKYADSPVEDLPAGDLAYINGTMNEALRCSVVGVLSTMVSMGLLTVNKDVGAAVGGTLLEDDDEGDDDE